LTGGYWFTPEHQFGVEGSFFQVDGGEAEFADIGGATPDWGRPVVNAGDGQLYAVPVSFPGVQQVSIAVKSEMDLLGAEALLRRAIRSGGNYRLDSVGGYRYQRLFDRLAIDESFDFGKKPAGTTTWMERFDHFESENEFHGGEVGLIGRWWGCRWALQALGKVALGGTQTTTTVDGGTVHTVAYDDPKIKPNPKITSYPGGVLALPSNRGHYSQSDFAAVGELGIRMEYALNKQCRLTLGYTVIYWPSVARVTDSIDWVVDTSQIVDDPSKIPPDANAAANRPSFAFRDTEFWTQGLNAGVHIDF
jgi:hypothetical protein